MDDITAAVVESVPELPITVKMRSGWSSHSIVSTEAGPRLEKLGVKAIALHPRTTKQGYKGKAKWELIKELKNAVSIPVIGNGDIKSSKDVLIMFSETGCDAVMVARATLGNPWFFKETIAHLNGSPLPNSPTVDEKISTCRRHLELLIQTKGNYTGTNLMRKHFGWYIKGFESAGKIRKELVTSTDSDGMFKRLNILG
jgi:tRNA-dihydrouridine synthase B